MGCAPVPTTTWSRSSSSAVAWPATRSPSRAARSCWRSIRRGFGLPEALGLRAQYDGVVHLLADGNEKLDESGVARIKVRAAARYNIDMPATAGVKLSGSGITLKDFSVSGAAEVAPSPEMQLAPAENAAARPFPKRSQEVAFRIGLTPTRDTNASATLTVSFSGGDLEEEFTESLQIKTREIAIGDSGEDVAKLQLYLSRIRAGNTPCYVRRVDDEGEPIRERRTIDGSYGAGTAEALWRFILFFSPMEDWPEDWTRCGGVELDRVARSDAEIEARVKELLAAEEYPVVDRQMIDQLIARHESPWVPPTLTFGSVTRFCDGPNQPPSTLPYWKDWSTGRRTTFLPYEIAQGGFKLPVTLVASTGGSLSGLKVEIVLREDHGYKLLEPIPKNAHELVTRGITVGPSGVMTAKKAKPRLDVYACDREVHLLGVSLGGTPNLHKSPTTGFAMAALQNLLALGGYYDGDIDGVNRSSARKAIKAAAKDFGTKPDDYVLLIARLVEDL